MVYLVAGGGAPGDATVACGTDAAAGGIPPGEVAGNPRPGAPIPGAAAPAASGAGA